MKDVTSALSKYSRKCAETVIKVNKNFQEHRLNKRNDYSTNKEYYPGYCFFKKKREYTYKNSVNPFILGLELNKNHIINFKIVKDSIYHNTHLKSLKYNCTGNIILFSLISS